MRLANASIVRATKLASWNATVGVRWFHGSRVFCQPRVSEDPLRKPVGNHLSRRHRRAIWRNRRADRGAEPRRGFAITSISHRDLRCSSNRRSNVGFASVRLPRGEDPFLILSGRRTRSESNGNCTAHSLHLFAIACCAIFPVDAKSLVSSSFNEHFFL